MTDGCQNSFPQWKSDQGRVYDAARWFCRSDQCWKDMQASKKSIYRLKKASRSWNIHFDEVVKGFGFIKNEEESCAYKKESGSSVAFLILYVDDILLIGNNIPMLESVKTSLKIVF